MTRPGGRRLATGLAGVVLVFGSLAACSGDDSGGGDAGGGTSEDSSSDTGGDTGGDAGGDTGGDASSASYCDELAAAQTEFDSLSQADPTQIDEAFNTLQSLGTDAPEQVAGDWDVVRAGFDRVEQALADAGLTFEDLSNPQTLLELDQQTIQQLQQELQGLDTPQFDDALTSISEHAEQECGVDLGGSGGGSGG